MFRLLKEKLPFRWILRPRAHGSLTFSTRFETTVPQATRMTVGQCRSWAASRNIRLVEEPTQPPPPIRAGQITASSPPPGTKLGTGEQLGVKVATGTFAMPGLTGQTRAAALRRLRLNYFMADVSFSEQATDQSLQIGRVLKQVPAAGTRVTRDQTVELVIGKQAEPRLPDFRGQHEAAARRWATPCGSWSWLRRTTATCTTWAWPCTTRADHATRRRRTASAGPWS